MDWHAPWIERSVRDLIATVLIQAIYDARGGDLFQVSLAREWLTSDQAKRWADVLGVCTQDLAEYRRYSLSHDAYRRLLRRIR